MKFYLIQSHIQQPGNIFAILEILLQVDQIDSVIDLVIHGVEGIYAETLGKLVVTEQLDDVEQFFIGIKQSAQIQQLFLVVNRCDLLGEQLGIVGCIHKELVLNDLQILFDLFPRFEDIAITLKFIAQLSL